MRGSGTCQAYLDAKSSHSIPEAVKHLTWFLGYVSGLAVANHVNILDKGDAESMVNWVDAYCDRYPARYISDAGDPVLQVSPGTDENSFLSEMKGRIDEEQVF